MSSSNPVPWEGTPSASPGCGELHPLSIEFGSPIRSKLSFGITLGQTREQIWGNANFWGLVSASSLIPPHKCINGSWEWGWHLGMGAAIGISSSCGKIPPCSRFRSVESSVLHSPKPGWGVSTAGERFMHQKKKWKKMWRFECGLKSFLQTSGIGKVSESCPQQSRFSTNPFDPKDEKRMGS